MAFRQARSYQMLLLSLALVAAASAQEGPKEADVPAVLAAALRSIGSDAEVSEASAPLAEDEVALVGVLKGCLPQGAGETFVARTQKAIDRMLTKKKKEMRLGLRRLAEAAKALGEDAEARCGTLKASPSPMLDASEKLRVIGGSKVNIEYEAMKTLKVGGHDVHLALNKFIGAWKKAPDSENKVNREVGETLGKLLRPFLKEGPKTAEL